MTGREACLNTALRLLTRRDHSCAELRAKLVQRGYADEQIEPVLAKCRRLNYLDDARFALGLLNSLRRRGYGRLRIAHRMQAKGLSRRLVDTVLEDHYPVSAQLADCREALARKAGRSGASQGDANWKRKLYRFLLQRGFASDLINEAFNDGGRWAGEEPST